MTLITREQANDAIDDVYKRALSIRGELIKKGEYTLENVRYLLDLQMVEDDGFTSDRTQALRMLVNAFELCAEPDASH